MINIQAFNQKDNLPEVDVFLNVLVAQLCVDIDRESHPERERNGNKNVRPVGKDE
jgi:hypothetical protein